MISVNGEHQQDLKLKVWANFDNPFWIMDFWSFKNPYYGLLQNLWCNCAQLSIGYVQRVSQNFISMKY